MPLVKRNGNGSYERASDITAAENVARIVPESEGVAGFRRGIATTQRLRQELEARGLKGFKRGGTVRKTGVYKLHKGEKVLPAPTRRPAGRGNGVKRERR